MSIKTQVPGEVIMFDGPDGVGKTEQIRLAAETLTSEGYDVYTTRVHGGTPFGEKLRDVSLSDTPRTPSTDLYLSHTMHIELAHDLRERKQKGQICLVDRSPATMWSYQVRASGLSEEFAKPVIEKSFELLDPKLLIIYLTSLHILKQRIAGRETAHNDFFENQQDSFHEWTIVGYTEAVKMFHGVTIDASASIDVVHQNTMEHIRKILSKHDQ